MSQEVTSTEIQGWRARSHNRWLAARILQSQSGEGAAGGRGRLAVLWLMPAPVITNRSRQVSSFKCFELRNCARDAVADSSPAAADQDAGVEQTTAENRAASSQITEMPRSPAGDGASWIALGFHAVDVKIHRGLWCVRSKRTWHGTLGQPTWEDENGRNSCAEILWARYRIADNP
jgi:hypothetical protein